MNTITRALTLTLTLAFGTGLGVTLGAQTTVLTPTSSHVKTVRPGAILPPCKHEDGPGPCYWNADTRGNGQGRSFIVTKSDRVIYLDGPVRLRKK